MANITLAVLSIISCFVTFGLECNVVGINARAAARNRDSAQHRGTLTLYSRSFNNRVIADRNDRRVGGDLWSITDYYLSE